MRKTIGMTAMVTVFLAAMLAMTFTAGAAIGGFSVSANLPENQAEGVVGFFDLWVDPGDTQEVTINIRNGRDEPISVEMSINPASTSPSGSLHYTVHEPLFDDSMQYRLNDLASFPGGEVTMDLEIPVGATAVVPVNIQIPDGGFDGMVLGGVHVLLGLTDEERERGGMLVNRFAQVMPIRLRINGTEHFEPDFALGFVRAEVVAGVSNFRANIHHTSPRISRNALGSMWVYQAGGDTPIMSHVDTRINFAPNTVFEFTLRDRARHGIPAGDYRARIQIEYEGQFWNFEEYFTVTPAEARRMADEAIGQLTIDVDPGPPIFLIVGLTLGGVLLLGLIAFLVARAKKKRSATQIDMSRMPPFNGSGSAAPPAEDKLKGVSQDELERMLEQMRKQNQNNSDK